MDRWGKRWVRDSVIIEEEGVGQGCVPFQGWSGVGDRPGMGGVRGGG